MVNGTYRDTLTQPGLHSFLWAQFLGAFNDNFFKITLSLLVVETSPDGAGRRLSLVGMTFVLPFLLFAGYAGQVADIYSKRTVIVTTKAAELVVASCAACALILGRLDMAYTALFVFAVLATFFSPAKYGILPELLPPAHLARANGLLEMSTFLAIVGGTAIGSVLVGVDPANRLLSAAVICVVATAGAAVSTGIPALIPAAPHTRLARHPWTGVAEGITQIRRNTRLFVAVIGISCFWFLAAFLQLAIVLFATRILNVDDRWIGALAACSAVGIATGSVLAGKLTTDRTERRVVVAGAIGMPLATIALGCSRDLSYAAAALTLAGVGAGLFVVPLNATLQRAGERTEVGRLMAANNLLNMLAALFASVALWIGADVVQVSADRLIVMIGAAVLIANLSVLNLQPDRGRAAGLCLQVFREARTVLRVPRSER